MEEAILISKKPEASTITLEQLNILDFVDYFQELEIEVTMWESLLLI